MYIHLGTTNKYQSTGFSSRLLHPSRRLETTLLYSLTLALVSVFVLIQPSQAYNYRQVSYIPRSLKLFSQSHRSISSTRLAMASETHQQARYYEAHGDPDKVIVESVPKPFPVPGTVVVKVHVSAVNPVDFKVLKGSRWGQNFPFSPGYDIAGVVEAVGDNVSGFAVGDRVFGVNWGVGRHNGADIPVEGGGFAEYSLVNATKLSHIPSDVSFEQAAAVALAGTTAYQCLFECLQLQAGQKVLIIGGSGAVGQLAVQLAKNAGAHVITTCSTRSVEFVQQFSPDKIIDYTSTAWELDSDVMGVDAVFDTIGVSGTFAKSKTVLKSDGRFVTIASQEAGADPLGHPPLKYASVYVLRNDPEHQSQLVNMIAEGKLKVIIEDKFPFSQDGVAGILKKVASGKSLGKNVLMVLRVD